MCVCACVCAPGQKYKTTLKNEEKYFFYNFLIMKN